MLSRYAFSLAMAAISLPSSAQTPPPAPPTDAKTLANPYVMAAGMSDLYEIRSSQIALQKTKNSEVRKFADMMVKHHQKTTAATMAAAKKAGLTPTPPALDAGATASIIELQGASAADFDRIYLGQQLAAHQAALELHTGYSTGGDQAALRTSAKAAVPVVQQHLDAVTKLRAGNAMEKMSGM
jgi:putative membrane protein